MACAFNSFSVGEEIMIEENLPETRKLLKSQRMSQHSSIELNDVRHASTENSWDSFLSGATSHKISTQDEDKVVLRKLDKGVILLLLLIQVLTAWEKSNIGYARVGGADVDLNLDADGWEAITIAFIFAFPSFQGIIVLLGVISPRIYFTSCMLAWGIVGALHSVTTSFGGLCFLRILLGFFEAALSGAVFYFSTFYKREELAVRITLWTGASALTIPLGGFLSRLIVKLCEQSWMAPWRGIFLFQGLLGILATIFIWGRLPDDPRTAGFFTEHEQHIAIWRLVENWMGHEALEDSRADINFLHVREALLDPQNYLYALIFFGANVTFTSMPVFVNYGKELTYAPMPKILVIIVYGLKFPAGTSMLLYFPSYIVSVLVSIAVAYRSDKKQNRGFYISIAAFSSILGYSFIALAGLERWSEWARYFGILLASMGFYTNFALTLTWLINNQSSRTKQLTSLVMVQGIGQWAPYLGSRLYPPWEYPLHTGAMWTCAAVMTGVLAVTICLQFYLLWLNKTQHSYAIVSDDEDTNYIFDKSNRFMYII